MSLSESSARIILPASGVRRNSRGDSAARKIVVHASAVENWSTALVPAWWVFLLLFSSFFLYDTYVYILKNYKFKDFIDN